MHDRADDIVAEARLLVGVRYGHQGRGARIDCAGVPIVVLHRTGISSYDTRDYSRLPDARQMKKCMMEAGFRMVPYRDMSHGDVVAMQTGRQPTHLGVIDMEDGVTWVIHASNEPTRMAVVRDELDKLDGRVLSVWRFPG